MSYQTHKTAKGSALYSYSPLRSVCVVVCGRVLCARTQGFTSVTASSRARQRAPFSNELELEGACGSKIIV